MLVWLVSTVPTVAAAIGRLAIEDEAVAVTGLDASTQHGIVGGRLDAFFTSPSIALIVESKLGSDYGDGQLRKYAKWLAGPQHDGRIRALMTLTERAAPWPASDEAYVRERGIVPTAWRWEDLYARLAPLAENDQHDPLYGRLVMEFLDMLSEEGLIPMLPLNDQELGAAWRDGRRVIRRYHKFFKACMGDIGEALSAERVGNGAEHFNWVWQGYRDQEGVRFVVGFHYTDEAFPLTPRVYSGAPAFWVAISGDGRPEWPALAASLDAHPPEGWHLDPRGWWGYRRIWRPAESVLGRCGFDDQRQNVASAAGIARAWLATAEAARAGTP